MVTEKLWQKHLRLFGRISCFWIPWFCELWRKWCIPSPSKIKTETKTYFTYEISGKNLYKIHKKSPTFMKLLLRIIQYITHTHTKVWKIWLTESAGNNLKIWLLSSGVIFLHMTFYWSCAVLNSSQGFSSTYFCWCSTLPLLERAQWRSLQSAAFSVVFQMDSLYCIIHIWSVFSSKNLSS